jgi:hypothetical protein
VVDSGAEDGAREHILIGGQTGTVSCANRRQSCEAPDRAQPGTRRLARARARRARETKSDQGQVVEILGFQAWKTGDNRAAKADRQRFPTSAGLRSGRGQHIGSLYVLIKSHGSGIPKHR